jgi:hypothetical protein
MEISPFIRSSVLIGEESPRPQVAENLQCGEQWRGAADDLASSLSDLTASLTIWLSDLAAPLTI